MVVRKFIEANVALSRRFDAAVLSEDFRIDGNTDFCSDFSREWVKDGLRIVDIGGGKHPFLSVERKENLNAYVVGVDIDATELAAAPEGAYDEMICADITSVLGDGKADLCICQAVLEHVSNAERALQSIASFLRPGGVALVFVPSRNAVFARLNLVLPENLKKKVLYFVFPHAREGQGFKSYYDRCTPRHFELMAAKSGMHVIDARYYFVSSYFSFFTPLYISWRAWIVIFRRFAGRQAAETFCMAMQRRS